MADNVAITAGAGTTVATDERTINSVAVHVQRVIDQGGTAVATGQVNISSTAATLLAARDTRKTVLFKNRQLEAVTIGPATVTTANGFTLDAGDATDIETTALLQGITAAATIDAAQKIHYIEVYDT